MVLAGAATDDEVAALRAACGRWRAAASPTATASNASAPDGDNAPRGLALLRGERRERDKRKRRLLLSALQSAVFNRALELRADPGRADARSCAATCSRRPTRGGLFVVDRSEVDQRRVDAGELIPTGPMPAAARSSRRPDTPARALEDEAIAAVGATREDFARPGRELPGRAPRRSCSGSPEPRFPRRPAPTPGDARRALAFHVSGGQLRDGGRALPLDGSSDRSVLAFATECI